MSLNMTCNKNEMGEAEMGEAEMGEAELGEANVESIPFNNDTSFETGEKYYDDIMCVRWWINFCITKIMQYYFNVEILHLTLL